MKKKIIMGIVLVLVLSGGFMFYKMKKDNANGKAKNQLEDLSSYHLEANMSMQMNDELKTYKVDVDYLKKDTDLFKVTIYDKTLNQSQIIIRNQEGVFVYTPSMNQVYKFKSEWPYNSEKPYIYQTLLKYFDSENKVEKVKDGMVLRSPITYPHDELIVSQEIKFDKNMVPMYVVLYDQEEVEHVKVDFTKVSLNEPIDEGVFSIEQTEATQTASIHTEDFPLLPLNSLGTELTEQVTCSINGVSTHILQFSGDKAFTLIQSIESPSEEVEMIETSAELVDLLGSVALYEDQQLKYLYPGMLCSVYSESMSKNEMIEVVNSLQNEVLK